MLGPRLEMALQGRLVEHMAAEVKAVAAGAQAAVRGATEATKGRIRAQVAEALTGRRAPNAIRSRYYGDGAEVAGIVYSKFGRREGGQFVDYMAPHAEGARIAAKGGFLVIPVKGTSRRLAQKYRRLDGLGVDPKLALIPLAGGRFLFVRRTKTRTTLLALLVRAVSIPKRLRLEGEAARAEAEAVSALVKNLRETPTHGR